METNTNGKFYNLVQIKHPLGKQPLEGFVSNAQTYTFKYRDRNDEEREVTGTIYQITDILDGHNKICDYDISISPLWRASGPLNERITFALTDVISAKQVYIAYRAGEWKSERGASANSRFMTHDRFTFHFPGNDVTATTEDFVKITYLPRRSTLKKGDAERKTVYGYLVDASTSDNKCRILAITGNRGIFTMNYMSLDSGAITAVYPATVAIEEYKGNKAKAAGRKRATESPVLKVSPALAAQLQQNKSGANDEE